MHNFKPLKWSEFSQATELSSEAKKMIEMWKEPLVDQTPEHIIDIIEYLCKKIINSHHDIEDIRVYNDFLDKSIKLCEITKTRVKKF